MVRRWTAIVAAIGLVSAPVAAANAESAAARALSLSVAQDGSDLEGGLSVGLVAGVLFVAAIVGLLVLGGDDEEDSPVSP